MSNKIVPHIYRAVIDDVISAIKSEFDEYGVNEEVLGELQHKWESKVVASHVADFDSAQPSSIQQHQQQQQQQHPSQHAYLPQHPIQMVPQHPHYPSMTTHSYSQPYVKAEPVDSRYNFNALPSYTIPPLPGPQLGTAKSKQSLPSGHQTVISFPSGPSAPGRPPAHSRDYSASQQDVKPPLESQQRIPQVDGPSSSSSESATPPPPSQPYAPRSLHPSLPPPLSQGSTSTAIDDEAINSDLDDSSTEGEDEAEEGAGGDTDIVFCTYDKVARVKNKRKCILKDGMIHINGKDYLFAKCTGEFEW